MRACILLHGFITNKDDFLPLIDILDEIYDEIINEDLPGHKSAESYDNFTVDAVFSHVLNTYDELAKVYSSIDCIGFSMGGALATYLQSVRKIDNMVLLSPANKYLNFRYVLNKAYFRYKMLTKKLSNITNKEKSSVDERIEKVRADDLKSFKMAIKRLIPNYTIRNLATFSKIVKKCNEVLEDIKPKTLIIWGQLDQLVPKESVLYDYSICKNKKSKLLMVEDLSHLMLRSRDIEKIQNEVAIFLK